MKILAADIGGTKSRLAIIELSASGPQISKEQTYLSSDYSGLGDVARDFLQTTAESPTVAGWSVAGPIKKGRSKLTNLPWQIDADRLGQELGLSRSIILNDLEAWAWGIPALSGKQICTLQPGADPQPGNRAIISAGTGLGEAGAYWDGETFHPFATEGGHCDFAPTTQQQFELSQYLQREFARSTWEDVLSGPGLINIFNFLLQQDGRNSPEWFLTTQAEDKDLAAAIFSQADTNQDSTAVAALELFIRLYAAEAGNLALKHMARGGLYIGGGIAPKIITWLQRPTFLHEFSNKGKMQKLMESIPLHVIMDNRTALYGLALHLADCEQV